MAESIRRCKEKKETESKHDKPCKRKAETESASLAQTVQSVLSITSEPSEESRESSSDPAQKDSQYSCRISKFFRGIRGNFDAGDYGLSVSV